MAFGHRGLAGLDVRRPRHAPLYGRGRALRRRIAPDRYPRPDRRLSQFADPGGLSAGLGRGRRVLWPAWRPPGAFPDLDAHDPHLRPVHRPLVPRAGLVAPAHLSLSVGPGYRRRMGRRRGAAQRDLAATMAALDCCRAANRRQRRHRPGDGRRLGLVRVRLSRRLPDRHSAGTDGRVDLPGRARDGRMARGQGAGGRQRAADRRSLSRAAAADDDPCDRRLLALALGALGLHVLVLAALPHGARDRRN